MAALARRVNEDSLLADQLKLTDRQNKLERAISDFQLKAEMHMAAAFGEDEAVELAPAYNGDDWADEAEDPDVTEELAYEDVEDGLCPETIPLRLPSMLGKEQLEKLGMKKLGERELALREGQANDALHHLRMTIGMKSVTFYSRVRTASGQHAKTRAWREVQGLAKTITEQARVYSLARNAMKRLLLTEREGVEMEERFHSERRRRADASAAGSSKGDAAGSSHINAAVAGSSRVAAPANEPEGGFKAWLEGLPDLLRRFKPLGKDDLAATMHLFDHREQNSRQKELSWIWADNIGGDTEKDWLAESEQSIFFQLMLMKAGSSPGQLAPPKGEMRPME